jgi:hypothetical protein
MVQVEDDVRHAARRERSENPMHERLARDRQRGLGSNE